MPKFAKRFLAVLTVLVAAAALVLLFINLYLQSGGVQQRIREAASRSLGAELKIRSTSYTPWSGLVLRDISVVDPTNKANNLVEATALRVRFALPPLFQQRFVVTECVLFEPRVVVRQMENGDWLVPLPPKAPRTAPETAEKTTAPRAAGPVFRAEVDRMRLVGGYIVFIDAKNQILLELEKASLDAEVKPDLTAAGTFEIARANIMGSLRPKRVRGPFSWNGEVLDLPQVEAALAGGTLKGNYRVAVQPNPSYTTSVSVENAELRKLFREAGVDYGKTEGTLKGTLQLAGDPRKSDTTTGKGHFELVAAKLTPMDFLVKLGEVLNVDELQLLQLEDAKIDLSVRDQRVWVDDLRLKSENLILTARGPIRFNRKMSLEANLLVNQKLQQQLKGVLSKNFVQAEDPAYKQVTFAVTGKLDSPKTDLVDKVIGVKLGGDLGGFLKGFFRSAPSRSDSNNKDNDQE